MNPLANASPAPSTFSTSISNGGTSIRDPVFVYTREPALPRFTTSVSGPPSSSAAAARSSAADRSSAAVNSSSVPIAMWAWRNNDWMADENVVRSTH